MCLKRWLTIGLALLLVCGVFAGCDPVDKDYGVVSEPEVSSSQESTVETAIEKEIMSSDRVMSKYFDISLFDEENYAEIYLGKKFTIEAEYLNLPLSVPATLKSMSEAGWNLAEGNIYDANSLVFSYETIDVTFVNEAGVVLAAQMYNSSRSSIKLSECYVVKFRIDNDYYQNPQEYHSFNINGIVNNMAITDIIYTLGTPSHFYKVSDECYYLDYFITKKDRRNGITVYIDPVNDGILAVEFSYYK